MTAEAVMSNQNINPSDQWIVDPVTETRVGLKKRTGSGLSMVPVTYTGSPATDAIIALAGGGQAGATQLLTGVNRVVTVATGNDSVMLPKTVGTCGGQVCIVINGHATNSMQVFGSDTDTINAIATGTGIAHAATVVAMYVCVVPGQWVVTF